MEILKFKTNISDENGINKIASHLDTISEIENWQVDTSSEENILSVSGNDLDPQKIENVIAEAGFTSEILRVLGIGGEDL